ncbi:3'-5' exonuclease [Mycoplasma sp. 1199]|uniref:ATP-dependent helicase n=1 Tax=Mycoplasma sp. 1199 TaxID=3108526 RepID=UPI002B1E26B7|nr:UvrD-helicase domain-containing protein [Mycoplasma sp. 1199]MEA4206172.1 3'-5' exonuclease [Mycoplasma sp. 1199]
MGLIKPDLLSDLNEQQREAVEYFDSPLRIIAGAGSGKTRVLTRKIAYLINDLGVSYKNILALTFTNKAANEMKERVLQYCSKSVDSDQLKISTFHSFCAKLLRRKSKLIGFRENFIIVDDPDKIQILQGIYEKRGITSHDISYKTMIEYISWAKNFQIQSGPELAKMLNKSPQHILAVVYQDYLNELTSKGAVDFDDLIIFTKLLFDTHPEVVEELKKLFEYMLVDEFQDTSKLQYEVIKQIIGPNTHFTIVGDPDQTIYNWRGADVNLILDFDKDFENVKTIVLDTNYRSSKKILDAANNLIIHNSNRVHKNLITENEEGLEIEYYHGFNSEAEARWVVQKINELKKQKQQLKSIAILYRANYLSRPIEDALIAENINYKIFNGIKFFQRAEVKDALAFLKVLANPNDDISFERVINVPNRGIGHATLKKLKDHAENIHDSLFNIMIKDIKILPISKELIVKSVFPFLSTIRKYQKALLTNKISLTLNKFLEEIKYYEHIEMNKNLRGSAIDNVKELINSIQNWESNNPDKSAIDYLNEVGLTSIEDEYDNLSNYVSLMTIHSAKGLEFDNVFVIGMSEGVFPNKRALDREKNKKQSSSPLIDKYNDTLEDERRLAYVAVTRAKQRLFLSDSRGKLISSDIDKKPSRFIGEMGVDISDFIINYHGRKFDDPTFSPDDETPTNNNIVVGDIISHVMFGEGEVVEVKGTEIVIDFIKDRKIRTLNKNHPSIKVITR